MILIAVVAVLAVVVLATRGDGSRITTIVRKRERDDEDPPADHR